MDAAGVGESSEVEPGRCHAFGESRAVGLLGEEAIDQTFVRVVAGIGEEVVEFGGSWRKSGEIEVDASGER